MRTETSVVRVVRVLVACVTDELIADLWKIDMPVQRRLLAVPQEVFRSDLLATCVDKRGVQTGRLIGRHFERPGETVAKGERGLHMPRIAEINVIGRNNAVR